MKKKFTALLLLLFFACSALPVQAASDHVLKFSYEMSGLEFYWEGGAPDQYGTPVFSYINLAPEESDRNGFRVDYSKEYYAGEEYIGSYYFSTRVPERILDLRKSFDSPIDLDLELDGWGYFQPADPDKGEDEKISGDALDEEEPPYEQPEPFEDHLSLTIHAEPYGLIKIMMNSKDRFEPMKSNQMIKGKVADLTVTGTVNGEDFISDYGSLMMILFRNIDIGYYEEEPPYEEGTATMAGSEIPAKGKPLTQNYNQINMEASAETFIEDEEGIKSIDWQSVMLYLMDNSLEVYTDSYSYDSVENVEIEESFSGYLEDYSWDPADFNEGIYEISVEVTGVLTKIIYRWPVEEEEVEAEVTTEEVTRHITLNFVMAQTGTSRNIVKVSGQDYAVKEHHSSIHYSGDATIYIDDHDPLSGRGYATFQKSKTRMFGDVAY